MVFYMSKAQQLKKIAAAIGEGEYDGSFGVLYPGRGMNECRERYINLINLFVECYTTNEDGGEDCDKVEGAGACGLQTAKTAIEDTTADTGANSSQTEIWPNGDDAADTGAKTSQIELWPNEDGNNALSRVVLISAPGRAEVCGNHTDHQHGNVLAAAIDQDIICIAATNGSDTIRVRSVGHSGMITVNMDNMEAVAEERGADTGLIRGIAAWFKAHGADLGGFDAYTASNVPIGSGLSSSAAFEVVIGTAINTLFKTNFSPLDIAIAGQFAENNYFGKPCGLMDQTASSVGGFVRIDFADPKNPVVEPIQYDPAANGLRLCVVNTKGNHANLIGEYASIPGEMRAVASFFDKEFLRDVGADEFYDNIAKIRQKLHTQAQPENVAGGGSEGSGGPEGAGGLTGADNQTGTTEANDNVNGYAMSPDRAILRAIHFFSENQLVSETAAAIRSADSKKFLECINRSGQSSFCYLQNIYAPSHPGDQGLSLALALSESILRGKGGAWRVHGGGFAGTIMAFVPNELYDGYINALGSVFGMDSCITLSIRKFGGVEVTPG